MEGFANGGGGMEGTAKDQDVLETCYKMCISICTYCLPVCVTHRLRLTGGSSGIMLLGTGEREGDPDSVAERDILVRRGISILVLSRERQKRRTPCCSAVRKAMGTGEGG